MWRVRVHYSYTSTGIFTEIMTEIVVFMFAATKASRGSGSVMRAIHLHVFSGVNPGRIPFHGAVTLSVRPWVEISRSTCGQENRYIDMCTIIIYMLHIHINTYIAF